MSRLMNRLSFKKSKRLSQLGKAPGLNLSDSLNNKEITHGVEELVPKKEEKNDRPPPPKPSHGSIKLDMKLMNTSVDTSLTTEQIVGLIQLYDYEIRLNLNRGKKKNEGKDGSETKGVSYEVMMLNLGIVLEVFDDFRTVARSAVNDESEDEDASRTELKSIVDKTLEKYNWVFFVESVLAEGLRNLLTKLLEEDVLEKNSTKETYSLTEAVRSKYKNQLKKKKKRSSAIKRASKAEGMML